MEELPGQRHRPLAQPGMSRRDFLGRAAALGTVASPLTATAAGAEDAPRKGGILRLGVGGGSTADGFDPSTWNDSVMIVSGFGIFNALVENGPANRSMPDLAEHFEPQGDAATWVLDLRKGVEFHNGKSFTADDAIFSLNRHRGHTTSGAAGPMRAVKDIIKLDPHRIRIVLASPDADFPSILADYHIMMVPEGFADWERPIGTGAFTLDTFDPGVRIDLKKAANFWRSDRGHLDAVQILVINDSSARLGALISGQVDAVNRVDPKTIKLLQRRSGIEIVRAAGGWFPIISMMIDHAPYDSPDLRTALKFALDRPQMLKTLFNGYGSLGNDHPIPRTDPFFDADLPQTPHDPDRARFHFKRAGLSDPKILCQASDAAFNGAVDMATLFQTNGAECGIPIGVKKEPADGFYDGIWLKVPCATSYWAGRPAATQMLGITFKADAPWNETHWRNERFDRLLDDARAELNAAKRREYIHAMQAQLNADGGALIPVFRDWLDAHANHVGGHTPHAGFDMDNCRIAEKAWLKA